MSERKMSDARAKLLLGRVAEIYARTLNDNPKAKRVLTELGLGVPNLREHFLLGYGRGTLLSLLPSAGNVAAELTSLGVLDAGAKEFFKGCITCPLRDEQGSVTGLVGWPIEAADPAE